MLFGKGLGWSGDQQPRKDQGSPKGQTAEHGHPPFCASLAPTAHSRLRGMLADPAQFTGAASIGLVVTAQYREIPSSTGRALIRRSRSPGSAAGKRCADFGDDLLDFVDDRLFFTQNPCSGQALFEGREYGFDVFVMRGRPIGTIDRRHRSQPHCPAWVVQRAQSSSLDGFSRRMAKFLSG
jgi:hypothetical protein